MTNTDPVRALIETWRNAVKDFDERQNKTLNAEQREWLSGISEGIDRCTDELEAALASASPSAPMGVAYLDIGAGGYMDLGSELSDEELAKLPYGRHVLGIIGTHGVDGYVLAQQPAAPGIDLAERVLALLVERGSIGRNGEHYKAARALIDASPKGGSNTGRVLAMARDAWQASDEARDAALNTLAQMFHNSEEMEGPDGMVVSIDLSLWHEALEAYEVLIDGYDEVTLATSVGVEGLMQLAREWCLSWGEWAHDADPGCAKENAAEAALRAALTQALSQQPAACPKCGGTGEADSGGIHPWGAPAMIPCDCQQPAAVDGACAAAAVRFALTDPEGMTFLRLWNEGEFDTIRREWPDAPSEIYVGADPLAARPQEVKDGE